jgi:hypothetical protein
MLNEYGASGSATYAVMMNGIDPMMAVLPDNDYNQISARNLRDVVYTLWETGGGAGEFFYTQTAPLDEKSTIGVGGISANRTFEQVPLQQLFDEMFFPPLDNSYSISGGGSYLFGEPNVTITVTVTFDQKNVKNFSDASVTLTSTRNVAPYNGTNIGASNVPTGKGTSAVTNYPNQLADSNQTTTWTLNAKENGVQLTAKTTQVTWFLNRYYGVVNLNSLDPAGTSDFDLTSSYAKNTLTYENIANAYLPFTGPNRISISGTKLGSKLQTISFNNPNGYHLWMAWPSTDYGDGIPNRFVVLGLEANSFTKLKTGTFVNEKGYGTEYTLFVSNKKNSSITLTIEG